MISPGQLLFGLLRGAFFYSGFVALFVAAIMLLGREYKRAAIFAFVSLIPAAVYGVMWLTVSSAPGRRVAEVAAFPRVVPSEAERPRMLIIHDYSFEPPPYTYFLAETGRFDVFVIGSPRFRGAAGKIWRLEVAESDYCKETRKDRAGMVVKTGWRRCAQAAEVDRAPGEGLVLYTSGVGAPHSWLNTTKARDPDDSWTLELAWRQGAEEKLVAYDEFLAFPEMRFNYALGPYALPRDPPRTRDGRIAAPERATFVLKALNLDEELIWPQPLTMDTQRRLLEELTASGRADDTQRALELIEAGVNDALARDVMARMSSSPVTATQMLLKKDDRFCRKVQRLWRFRNELIAGCLGNAVPADACGLITYPRQWLSDCADNSVPIWRKSDKPARRVFIGNVLERSTTNVVLSKPAGLIEVRVPPDRGAIDLVMRNADPTIYAFTGAVSCISRLTVLEHRDAATGIVGIARNRIRFAQPPGSGSSINSNAPFHGDFAEILGIRPDVSIVDHRGAIDLAETLPKSAAAPCVPDGLGRPEQPPKDTDVLKYGIGDIVTAPPLLPLIRKPAG